MVQGIPQCREKSGTGQLANTLKLLRAGGAAGVGQIIVDLARVGDTCDLEIGMRFSSTGQ